MLPHIALDRRSDQPLHHQIGDGLRRLILAGLLPGGARLPSTRRAAAELGVSRNVVVLAYEQLQLEGYLKSAVGVGTWVPESIESRLLPPIHSGGGAAISLEAGEDAVSKRGGAIASQASPMAASRPTRPFRPSAVAADLFPARIWAGLQSRLWRTRTQELVLYGDSRGYGPLRDQIALHLARYRGVRCDPGSILVTSGSKQSLDLIGRMLTDPGDRVVVEDPGYYGATGSLAAVGAVLVPAPVDDQGLDLRPVREETEGAKLIYVTPSHQYPLGVTMSLERRLALTDHARRTGSWIIEDDYDSEYRYEARPLPALQGLDQSGRVVYVGTFSKVLAPALRMGFIVLPEPLVRPFQRAREVTDYHPPISVQAALADFMAGGHLERHIARMRHVYADRRAALKRALHAAYGDRYSIVPGDAGLHLTLLLGSEVDDAAVSRRAEQRGLDVQPLSAHYRGKDRRSGLLLGYGGFPPERLEAEVLVLRECIDAVRGDHVVPSS